MSKRHKEGVTISLFPFLSILACVIGVLTLLICALALSQLDEPDTEAIERAEAHEQMKEDIATLRIDLDKTGSEMKSLLARATRLKEVLSISKTELKKLESQRQAQDKLKAKVKAITNKQADLLVQKKKEEDKIKAMNVEIKARLEAIKKLEAQVKDKTKKDIAPVVVRPGGSGGAKGFEPFFIECSGNQLIIHDPKKTWRLNKPEVDNYDKRLIAFYDSIATNPKKRLVFIVRQNGTGIYKSARHRAHMRRLTSGKLPVIGKGPLDLSLFRNRK